MTQRIWFLLICALVTTSACFGDSERHSSWDRERGVIGPIAVKSRVAYVDTARDRVIVIETAEGEPRLHSFAIGRNATFAVPTPDREKLAIITRGEEALSKGQVDEDPALWVVDISTPGSKVLHYPIGSAFDRLAMAADGSVAVAYFSSGGFDAESGVFRNPNELAVVDLTRESSDTDSAPNPVLRTVRSFGSAPDGVVLSPPMVIPGAADDTPRVFAFILALDTLTILDATHPLRREVTIRLGTGNETIRPREIVFAPNTATAYLRSDNASDVLAVLLNPEAPESETDNDYQPSLAELGAGAGPSDVAVYDDAVGRRFVLASMPSRRQVAIIDGDTAEFVTVSTPDPIDRIMLFPGDPNVPPRFALLAAISQGVPRVHLLALEGISDQLVPVDLRTVNLAEPVLDVVAVDNSQRALIVHDADRTVLGLLDVGLGSVSPLEGVGRLDSYDFSDSGQFLVGITRQVDRVGFLNLETLHPSDMRLDDEPRKVLSLTGGAVFVDHGDPFGRATYIPNIEDSRRKDAVVLSGFLLNSYLDEDY